MTRITARLGTQLGLVSRDGTRRTAARAPDPGSARRIGAGAAAAEEAVAPADRRASA
ncbi:hypothetical protein [Streptomyces sp. NPDC058092]|uniref:hypothetical protein n=1 Tax=Streptomyces sp. NPDC058092 TaxID=3346336 RepID=UPI0036ECB555